MEKEIIDINKVNEEDNKSSSTDLNKDNDKTRKILPLNSQILKQQCQLINLITSPYFGIYSTNYEFFIPTLVISKNEINSTIYEELPNSIKSIYNKFNKVQIDYMILDVDNSFIFNHNKIIGNTLDTLRVNVVIHPYLFYDLKFLNKDHKSEVLNAIYKESKYDCLNLNKNENDFISIDPSNFMEKNNLNEVILHESDGDCALSPNNNTFLINVNNPLLGFYYVCGVLHRGNICKLLISKVNIIQSESYFPYKDSILLSSKFMVQDSEFTQVYLNKLIRLNYENKILINSAINVVYFLYKKLFSSLIFNKSSTDTGRSRLIKEYKKNIFRTVMELLVNYNRTLNSNSNNNSYYINYINFSIEDFKRFLREKLDLIDDQCSNLIEEICFGNIKDISSENDLLEIDFNTFFFLVVKYFNYKSVGFERMVISKLVFYIENIKKDFKAIETFITLNELDLGTERMKVKDYFKNQLQSIIDKNNKFYSLNSNNTSDYDVICEYIDFSENKINSNVNFNINEENYVCCSLEKQSSKFPDIKSKDLLQTLNIYFFDINISVSQNIFSKNIFSESIVNLELLMNTALGNREMLEIQITNFSQTILDYIFFNVWKSRGSIVGIHSDFGRLSFLNSALLPNCYYLSLDEIVEIIFTISSLFETINKE